MKKKIIIILILVFTFSLLNYVLNTAKQAKKRANEALRVAENVRSDIEYTKHEEQVKELIEFLTVYNTYDSNGPLKLIRHGRDNDGGYIVPIKAFEKADVLLGYGIADDASFEEQFSTIYKKPSYGFDCGLNRFNSTNKQFLFISECIANDKYLYANQTSSKKISTYTQQIKKLHLENKKVFIKMDIEGAEYAAFQDILDSSKNITGIVLEIHFTPKTIDNAVQLLSNLSKNFILVHVHGNNCCWQNFSSEKSIGSVPQVLELTYINKSLVNTYKISANQTHPQNIDMPNCKHRADYNFTLLPNVRNT